MLYKNPPKPEGMKKPKPTPPPPSSPAPPKCRTIGVKWTRSDDVLFGIIVGLATLLVFSPLLRELIK